MIIIDKMTISEKIKKNWKKGYVSILNGHNIGDDGFYLSNNRFMSIIGYNSIGEAINNNDFRDKIEENKFNNDFFKIVDTIHVTELTGKFKKGDRFKIKGTNVVQSFVKYIIDEEGDIGVTDGVEEYRLSEIEPYFEESKKLSTEERFKKVSKAFDKYGISFGEYLEWLNKKRLK